MPPPKNQAASHSEAALSDLTQKKHNRYIVIFKDQPAEGIASVQTAQQAIVTTNVLFTTYSIPKDSLVHRYQWTIFGFVGELTKVQVKKLRSDPRIDHVVKDSYQKAINFKPSEFENHKIKASSSGEIVPWGVSRVYAPINSTTNDAWVIGTGVDVNHPDLNVDRNRSASFLAHGGANDLNGHGTAVAGLIAAIDNSNGVVGVTPGATIIALKACNQFADCSIGDVTAAVDYAGGSFSPGDVVNISLGFDVNPGNGSTHASNESPARVDHPNVYTLSAYDRQDDFASFSNYGNPPIDYGGPGVDLTSSAIGGGVSTHLGGTSFSAPIIAGLLLAAPQQLEVDGFVDGDPDGEPDPILTYEIPLTIYISGPGSLGNGETGTWEAHVSKGGDGSYDYQWYYTNDANTYPINWIADGTNSRYYSHTFGVAQVPQMAAVKVIVDDGDEQASSINYVYIQDPDCPPDQFCR